MSLLMGLILCVGAYAQQLAVSGLVLDADGEPLIGASVMVKGTQNGTLTDLDGRFKINAKKGDVLTVRYVGYETQEVSVTSNNITINMKEDTEQLDEVVVLGYGAESRKQDLSAAVGVVQNTGELQKRPVTPPRLCSRASSPASPSSQQAATRHQPPPS